MQEIVITKQTMVASCYVRSQSFAGIARAGSMLRPFHVTLPILGIMSNESYRMISVHSTVH